MTRKDLFKMIFPEVYTEPDNCLGIACNNSKDCNECEYRNYWEEPTVISKEVALTVDGWTKIPSLHNNIDWSMLKDIIDDALDNGFEVKVLNGTIYYREKQ